MRIQEPELPTKLTFEALEACRAALREYDRRRIEAGEAAPAQVQAENPVIPWPRRAGVLRFPQAEHERE